MADQAGEAQADRQRVEEDAGRQEQERQPERQPAEGNGQLETVIGVKDLTKTFGSQTVFEDVTCDIPKGKITVILGPSGTRSGSTTRTSPRCLRRSSTRSGGSSACSSRTAPCSAP